MSRYFEVNFNDLSDDKKQELIDDVVNSIRDERKEEAEQAIKNDKQGEYKGMSWQEVYCRIYLIDYEYWDSSEEDAKDFDWDYAVENDLEEKAENELYRAMKYLEIEVEI